MKTRTHIKSEIRLIRIGDYLYKEKCNHLGKHTGWKKTNMLAVDPSFQSSATEKRWEPKDQSEFIESVIGGTNPSPMIFADCKACYNYCKSQYLIEDAEYFKKWLDKYPDAENVFLNIDSFNRNETLEDFIHDKVKVGDGKYSVTNRYHDVNSKTNTFSTLHPSLREHILDEEISIVIYTTATRKDFSDCALAVNGGVPWNEAQKRNCSLSEIATVVRNLTDKHRKFLTHEDNKWFGKKAKKARGVDSWVATLFAACIYDWKKQKIDNDPTLNKMYSYENVEVKQLLRQARKTVEKFFTILNKDYYAFESKANLFHMFILLKEAWADNYHFDNKTADIKKKEMFDQYVKAVTRLVDKYQGTNLLPGAKKYTLKPFEQLFSGMQVHNLNLCHEKLKEEFDVTKFMIKRDDTRVHKSGMTRLVNSEKQNWKTPAGNEIKPSELQTNKYEDGHIIPHSYGEEAGGVSTRDNHVVETKDENRGHGATVVK